MDVGQIALIFTGLFKQKKISIHHVLRALQAFDKLNKTGSLAQKLSIISTIAYFFRFAIKNQLQTVEKFKKEVYFGFLQSSSQNRRTNAITKKRHIRRQVQRGVEQITINDLLQQAVAEGLNQANHSNYVTPHKSDSPLNLDKNSVILPPFQPHKIQQISQNLSMASHASSKLIEAIEWQPSKLQNYQKWLALTQNGIDLQKKQKLPYTKKKNPPKKQVITDQKIDVSQGVDQMVLLQKLNTKLKLSRQSIERNHISFTDYLTFLNPVLTNVSQIRDHLHIKLNQMRRKTTFSNERLPQSGIFPFPEDQNQFSPIKASKDKFLVDSNTKLDDLPRKILTTLNHLFNTHPKISFSNLCKTKELSRQQKGSVFYHMLQLDYRIEQNDTAHFGEIQIFANL